MPKGSIITEDLFMTVKQLQKIHKGAQAEQIAPLVCREATVIRKIMKCATWEEYCEYKKAKAEKERERVEKRKQEPEQPQQLPGQIEMKLDPVEEVIDQKTEMSDQVKMMRFQAAQVDKLVLKLDHINDTLSMILRAIRKE